MFEKQCKIIFIRHGSTIFNDQGRLCDFDNYPPINEKGKEEMIKVTKWLKATNSKIHRLITSPALRSIQSTRIICKNLKIDFEILNSIYEKRVGCWGGFTLQQLEQKFPEKYKIYLRDPDNFCPDGGESIKELNQRVESVLDSIVNENFQKKVVIVAHVGIIQSAIKHAIGIPAKNQERIHIPTGSATQINYYEGWSSLVYSGYLPL